MFRTNRLFTLLLLVALVFSACQPIQAPASSVEPAQPAAYTPRYEPADCFYEIPEGEQVECGYLIVPEDRSQPDGPTIRVHVINFKSRSATPAPDPVILVPGGPGSGRLAYIYLWTATPIADVMRAERDVIMIEHRGANYSEPAFYCPEMEADLADLAEMRFTEESAWSIAAYQACGERLAQAGHNLSVYGPLDAAADIADLRVAMGYDQINIYTASYGTLPTLHFMRDYPAGLRSVIIDSVWPPEINQTDEMLKVAQGVFAAVFARCGADDACNAAYPDLEKVLYQSLAELRANPVPVTVTDEAGQNYVVTIDDLMALQYIFDSGLFGEAYANLPAAMYAVHNGDFTAIAQDWLAYLSGRHSKAAPGTDTWSMGLNIGATCLHDSVTSDAAQAKAHYAATESNPSLRTWAEQAFVEEWLGPCTTWPITITQSVREIAPVSSEIPTMIWVNTFDFYMAPSFSTQMVERFPNSYLFEFPLSHGALFAACPLETFNQFLADPTQAPDASCIDEMMLDWVLPEE